MRPNAPVAFTRSTFYHFGTLWPFIYSAVSVDLSLYYGLFAKIDTCQIDTCLVPIVYSYLIREVKNKACYENAEDSALRAALTCCLH